MTAEIISLHESYVAGGRGRTRDFNYINIFIAFIFVAGHFSMKNFGIDTDLKKVRISVQF